MSVISALLFAALTSAFAAPIVDRGGYEPEDEAAPLWPSDDRFEGEQARGVSGVITIYVDTFEDEDCTHTVYSVRDIETGDIAIIWAEATCTEVIFEDDES